MEIVPWHRSQRFTIGQQIMLLQRTAYTNSYRNSYANAHAHAIFNIHSTLQRTLMP